VTIKNTVSHLSVPEEKYNGWEEILSNLTPVKPMYSNGELDLHAYTIAVADYHTEAQCYADRIIPEDIIISDILNKIEVLLDDKIGNEWGINAETSIFVNSLDSHLYVNGDEVYSWDDVCTAVENFDNDMSEKIGVLVRQDTDCIEMFSDNVETQNSQINDLVHHIGDIMLRSTEALTEHNALLELKEHSHVFNEIFKSGISKSEANTPF